MALSRYRIVWIFVLFDLPVISTDDRRDYARFRKKLLQKGFTMLQFSVYAKHLPSDDAAESIKQQVFGDLPPKGQVRFLQVTDYQFSHMEVYFGKKRKPIEDPPLQISLF
jgi:CRISPR-associated protein Cas2